ncbi:DUF3558 domain-containing protein [Amycolatopsis sp. H20-H5]|uniref:DUF3558 domain-containing protein n=1 Tax=Amycolatopsis sp. H20-H5 TaxID=3046309 RepID=UPI002DBC8CAA|nr:DUF3558 domain-containing protein [Amycolatopsis sp. H20-H5]MEC3980851.1 DUF3558 domain-containing protein [Amycolatopsis sp. H20-H5]
MDPLLRRLGVCVAGLLTVGALAACSTKPGTAQPLPSSSPTAQPSGSSQGNPGSGLPTITNPLPASVIQGDPCSVLTTAQLATLFSATPHRNAATDTGAAKSCSWSDLDKGSLVGIQLVYAWQDGLGHVYAKKNEGFFKELEPLHGYPVVAYGPSDDRSTGRCSVAVGVAGNAAFQADATLARSKVGQADPCDAARNIADLALTTLKGGA